MHLLPKTAIQTMNIELWTRQAHASARQTITVPSYPDLADRLCSAYARRAAADIFGKQFAVCHAWDRVHNDAIVHQTDDELVATALAHDSIYSGMIVGLYYPESEQNHRLEHLDKNAKRFFHTHVGLYLGVGTTSIFRNEHVIAHQFAGHIRVEPASLIDDGRYLEVRAIYDSKSTAK